MPRKPDTNIGPCKFCNQPIPAKTWTRSKKPIYCGNPCRIKGQRAARKAGKLASFATGGQGWLEPERLVNHSTYLDTLRYAER
jgi:hypothetical protein